jgi:uncharacterized sulfatase
MRWFCFVLLAIFANVSFAADKPNVLFIVSDDLNCQLGCYGNTVCKTPNIDRLATAGVRFDRAYVNYPVCNASRTSFLSGRRPDTTGVFGNSTNPRMKLGEQYQFMPEYFKAFGYFTAGIGKIAHGGFTESVHWDVQTDPQKDGDDEGGQEANRLKRRDRKRAMNEKKDAVDVPFPWQATDNADADEPDGITARKVVNLMEEHQGGPFFIAAGFHKPHVPHTAPKKYFDMYPPDRMKLPVEPAGHTKLIPPIARPPKYEADLTDEQGRNIITHYYAATTFMDAQVGVLLEAMDRLKLWDNTIVVFIGDHGWHLGEHEGFWAKSSLMQESAHSPLLVYAPGKKTEAECKRMIEYIDLFPTLCDLCGLPPQSGLEGTSFVPLMDDPTLPWQEAAYSVVTRDLKGRKNGLGRSVHTERWTYIAWPDGSEQLYDFTADPKEYNNLAVSAEHASTLDQMRALLKKAPHSTEIAR